MKKILSFISYSIKNIDYKSKRIWVLFGIFLSIVFLSSLYISYGYYINSSTKNIVISGKASTAKGDIVLQIYLQDRDSNGSPITDSYSRGYYIPKVNYSYDSTKTVCTTGTTITYNSSTYEFTTESTQKALCKVYFNADGNSLPNSTIELFVEQNENTGDYVKAGNLPYNDVEYEINTQKSHCTDPNAELSIVDRKIQVGVSMDLDCIIYADIQTNN